jgi:hypothetical protein
MQPASHMLGNGVSAAVTAVPATVNARPSRVTLFPARTPSAVASVRSSTTWPGRTQVPEVTSGWSTGTRPEPRPSATTLTAMP